MEAVGTSPSFAAGLCQVETAANGKKIFEGSSADEAGTWHPSNACHFLKATAVLPIQVVSIHPSRFAHKPEPLVSLVSICQFDIATCPWIGLLIFTRNVRKVQVAFVDAANAVGFSLSCFCRFASSSLLRCWPPARCDVHLSHEGSWNQPYSLEPSLDRLARPNYQTLRDSHPHLRKSS